MHTEVAYTYEELLEAYFYWVNQPKKMLRMDGYSAPTPVNLSETLKAWYLYCDVRDGKPRGTNWALFRGLMSDYVTKSFH